MFIYNALDNLVELIDIYPTLIDLAGFEPPKGETLEGVSLVPIIENREKNVFIFFTVGIAIIKRVI